MTQKREINRILVVDDESSICTMLTKFLRSCGYECESTTDPINAMSILAQGDLELLISDLKMASIDGLQLLKEVSKADRKLDTIIMTGYTHDYSYSDIIEAGAADFIAKPFETPEVKAKIERIDRERKMRRELQEMNVALEAKTHELEATNAALGVLLKRRDQDQKELVENVLINIEELILPCVQKLEAGRLDQLQMAYVDMLKSRLVEISSPFMKKLSQKHANLSPMEVQVATLAKAGKENKGIAEILGVSVNTIMVHRYHLRTKLGVKGEKVNLRSYLSSIDF